MSSINLSKAVRSNLLSLQSTAADMARTQNRLATGLKVNSALDNPSNFFTASALKSRAGDMANLLDAMSSGIKTIEAADNGIQAIIKTVKSMQSTLRQARQDKSFQTRSYAVDATAAGSISFSGGAVGATPVSIALGGGTPVQSTVAASADFVSPAGTGAVISFAFNANTTAWAPGDRVASDVEIDGGLPIQVDVETANVTAVGNLDNIIDDINEFTDAINHRLASRSDDDEIVATNDGTNVILTSVAIGAGHTLETTMVNDDYDGGGTINHNYGFTLGMGSPSVGGTDKQITIGNGTATASMTLTAANAATAGQARTYIQSELDAQGVSGVTVGGSGSRIDLAGTANGSTDLSIGGPDADDVFGAAAVLTPATYGGDVTVDNIVQMINNSGALSGRVRASNDAGMLRVQNLSTEALRITGIAADGEVDGSTGTDEIGGNDVRRNLVQQFNDLRDQLDKFADDASFNGINLLRGDKLKLTFNETGSSTINIQAKDSEGEVTSINSLTLGITNAIDSSFDSDATIDTRLDVLKGALDDLRSHSSSFGSNLSIVENRTDFTKSMIDTLETGAANLTLADTNEEAANLLALQTRQQLSSTAMSMASQADQAVLRLF